MTNEEQLAAKLESIRDSIIGSKFVIDVLETRANKTELELAECRSRISDLSNTGIRVGEQLAVINKSMDMMSEDIRSVRNSVLSAIIGAMIIWVAGTVVSTFHVADKAPSAVQLNK
jgi:hypothetical protein